MSASFLSSSNHSLCVPLSHIIPLSVPSLTPHSTVCSLSHTSFHCLFPLSHIIPLSVPSLTSIRYVQEDLLKPGDTHYRQFHKIFELFKISEEQEAPPTATPTAAAASEESPMTIAAKSAAAQRRQREEEESDEEEVWK